METLDPKASKMLALELLTSSEVELMETGWRGLPYLRAEVASDFLGS